MFADMHTHSESSHDSVCKIEEMLLAQLKKGTHIMAVTDHFDTASYNDYDIFTPIKAAADTVKELQKKYEKDCLPLSGIEISEAIWYPEVYREVMGLVDYDVVIGSVHLVRDRELPMAYSRIDFSKLPKERTLEYLDTYFDDMLAMIEETDFDILAHLTCPIRYMNGKYNLGVEVSQYNEKIETILKRIIEKGIALEVNTSSYEMLQDFMPGTEIIKKYLELGGYLITLGSDAHVSENASFHFQEAIKILKEIGCKDIYYYKKRKPQPIEIGGIADGAAGI